MAIYVGGAKIKHIYVGGTKIKAAYVGGAKVLSADQGTFTDPRDGKVYGWKRMPDGRIWMTENLDYAGNSGLYYNNAANPPFAKAGRLYTYDQAKAAVPAGWHLSSDAEWAALAIAAGGTGTWGESGTAGTKLKAKHTWNAYNNIPTGTNDYGFSALPGGYKGINSEFSGLNYYGYWWTSVENPSIDTNVRIIKYSIEYVFMGNSVKSVLYSVRCVKD